MPASARSGSSDAVAGAGAPLAKRFVSPLESAWVSRVGFRIEVGGTVFAESLGWSAVLSCTSTVAIDAAESALTRALRERITESLVSGAAAAAALFTVMVESPLGIETPAAESTHFLMSVTRAASATEARRTESCLAVVSAFAFTRGGTTAAVNCALALVASAASAQTSSGMYLDLKTNLR
jgi:hypothetical protein